MTNKQTNDSRLQAKINETQAVRERMAVNRIIKWVLLTIVTISLLIGIGGFIFVKQSLKSVDSKDNKMVEVTIPIGSGLSDVASILKEHNIISNEKIFSFYLKFNNDQALQAGHYEFSKSMDAEAILKQLKKGGTPIMVDVDTKLTVVEGMQLVEIAEMVGKNTPIIKDEFLETANNPDFIKKMMNKYPELLKGIEDNSDLKYPLEGYLFPYTYDYIAGTSAEDLMSQMIESANKVYQGLADDLVNTKYNYHQILTLASIIEKEAVTKEDRGLVSGVFYNRLNADQSLESDITVLYALEEHKEFVTLKDIEVDSPYNLYKHSGLGPGPYNTPSREAILAAIYPTWNDYYYFVADIDTGEVYYSSTIEEHEVLVEQYVNSRQSTEETINEETTTAN